MKNQILVFALLIAISFGNLTTRYETRRCTEDQKGGTNEEFANRLKNYVYNDCVQQSGYCTFENPSYPIQNQRQCSGSRSNIGWIITYTFNEEFPTNYEIDWGTDFGGGSAIFVNGVLDVAYQQDFWWAMNWNSHGVFNLNYDFPAGQNEILVVANEFCCDGPMQVQFSRNGGPKKPLTEDNFSCQQQNNCDGVVCQDHEYKVGFECHACDYNCKTCEQSADKCLTCQDDENRLQAPTCACKAGFYDVEGNPNCQQCHSSCETCSDGTSCDTCPPHHYKDGVCHSCATAHGDPNCGTCNSEECLTCKDFPLNYLPLCTGQTCLTNQYLVGKICKNCPATCKTCIDNTGCSTCEDNEYMENRVCKSCATKYGAHCGTCNLFQCETCLNDPANKLPDCNSTTCPPGKMTDGNHCRDCIAGCKTCSNQTVCEVCFDGYFKTGSNTCTPCTSPCLTCENTATDCILCEKANFDIDTECTTCLYRFFDLTGECASCVEYYGEQCGVCDNSKCTRCHNNQSYMLPLCTSTQCPVRQWKDDHTCKDCIANCLSCNNGTQCEVCNDMYYKDGSGICQQCTGQCLLCKGPTECTLCKEKGWKPPGCDSCGQGFFMLESECVQQCPEGYYGSQTNNNTCQKCDDTCFDCENDAYYCTSCPNEKFLYNGKCVDCDDVTGMEQDPNEPKGICREICGDGRRLIPNSIHECDDGERIDGDGCNSNCEIEDGWVCSGGSIAYPDVCVDKRPIRYTVVCEILDEYLNIEENSPIHCEMKFTKKFTLPEGTNITSYIVIKIEGKDTNGFKVEASLPYYTQGRLLQESQNYEGPAYNLTVSMDQTIRNRDMVVSLYPATAFQDGSGNILADDNEEQKMHVNDYFYYNEEERDNTKLFEFWMELSVMALMCFLPIYVFYYKNHFNRFYVIFMIIDSTQTLYFYRFLNIRWAINGIKFYRKLRPVIGFYMYNFYKKDISEDEFEDYSSGVTKFDKERESALFMNNTGNILTLLYLYIFVYLVVVLLSSKRVYGGNDQNKVYRFFHQARYGYFQWGVWFDSMMASCGVFIIYIFLQLTNPFASLPDTIIAIGVAVFYFGFFIVVARYISKNLDSLYTVQKDEEVDGLSYEDKMENNKTFKLRNVWHFVYNLHHLPQKGYFYYIFILRKIYLAAVLLIFQELVTIQLLMCSFSHLIVIIGLLKYKFFQEKKDTWKAVASESLIFLAIGCMYFMLDDVSEEESYRLTFSWIVLALLLMSLFIHGIYFLANEIVMPVVRLLRKKEEHKKVVDLRTLRKEGKLDIDQNFDTVSIGSNAQSVNSNKDKESSIRSKENSQLLMLNTQNESSKHIPLTTDSPLQDSQVDKVKKSHFRSKRRLNSANSYRSQPQNSAENSYRGDNNSQIEFASTNGDQQQKSGKKRWVRQNSRTNSRINTQGSEIESPTNDDNNNKTQENLNGGSQKQVKSRFYLGGESQDKQEDNIQEDNRDNQQQQQLEQNFFD